MAVEPNVGVREAEAFEGLEVVDVDADAQATFVGRGDFGVGLRSADFSADFDCLRSRSEVSAEAESLVSSGVDGARLFAEREECGTASDAVWFLRLLGVESGAREGGRSGGSAGKDGS